MGEDTFYLPWEYMPQSDGRIYHEGTGKKQEGVAGDWEIESAAVSREGDRQSGYPPARRKLLEQGIPCGAACGAADDAREIMIGLIC